MEYMSKVIIKTKNTQIKKTTTNMQDLQCGLEDEKRLEEIFTCAI